MDTFHLTRETQTDTLECIYTARIEAWTVDDWTRDSTVHLNHRDLVSYASFNNNNSKTKKKKKKKISHRDDRMRRLVRFRCLQKQFSHFSRNNQISAECI